MSRSLHSVVITHLLSSQITPDISSGCFPISKIAITVCWEVRKRKTDPHQPQKTSLNPCYFLVMSSSHRHTLRRLYNKSLDDLNLSTLLWWTDISSPARQSYLNSKPRSVRMSAHDTGISVSSVRHQEIRYIIKKVNMSTSSQCSITYLLCWNRVISLEQPEASRKDPFCRSKSWKTVVRVWASVLKVNKRKYKVSQCPLLRKVPYPPSNESNSRGHTGHLLPFKLARIPPIGRHARPMIPPHLMFDNHATVTVLSECSLRPEHKGRPLSCGSERHIEQIALTSLKRDNIISFKMKLI